MMLEPALHFNCVVVQQNAVCISNKKPCFQDSGNFPSLVIQILMGINLIHFNINYVISTLGFEWLLLYFAQFCPSKGLQLQESSLPPERADLKWNFPVQFLHKILLARDNNKYVCELRNHFIRNQRIRAPLYVIVVLINLLYKLKCNIWINIIYAR